VYAAEHEEGRFSMRGVKLASEMACVADAMPATYIMAQKSGMRMVGSLGWYFCKGRRWWCAGECLDVGLMLVPNFAGTAGTASIPGADGSENVVRRLRFE
jgi:hypothetical protein